jgi:O-antigen/teichoic acid export membrane protein
MEGAFTLSGMDTTISQAVTKGYDYTLLSGSFIKLKWSLFTALVVCTIGVYYLFANDELLGYSFVVTGLLFPLLYASSPYTAFFTGKKQFRKIAIDNISKNIIVTLSTLAIALYVQDILWIVIVYLGSNTLISATRFWLLARTVTSNSKDNGNSILAFGKHLSYMDIFSTITTHIDKIVVFQLLGATSLAIYVLAQAPIKQIQGMSKILRTLLIPKFSGKTIVEFKRVIPHKFGVFMWVSIGIVIIYCVIAEYAFSLLFPKYMEAVIYSQFLSVSLLTMPFIFHTQAFIALNRTRELYILNVTKPVIKIGLLLLLVPPYGIWGAVASFLIFYLIHFATLVYFFNRVYSS